MFGYAAFSAAPFSSLPLGVYYDLQIVENVNVLSFNGTTDQFYFNIAENVVLLDTPNNNSNVFFTRVEPISSVLATPTTQFAYNQLVTEVLSLIKDTNSVVGWIKVNDSQTVTWNSINNGQTTVWSGVNNTEITNWNPVNNIQ